MPRCSPQIRRILYTLPDSLAVSSAPRCNRCRPSPPFAQTPPTRSAAWPRHPQNITFVDVRTQALYNTSHIRGAFSLPANLVRQAINRWA
jgi:hypothetical protein